VIFEAKDGSVAVLEPEFRALKLDGVWMPLPSPFTNEDLVEFRYLRVKDSTRASSLLTEAKSALADNPDAQYS